MLIFTSVFCVASAEATDSPVQVEEAIYDYKPIVPEAEGDIRRREAGLSEEEKDSLQSTGSTNRGSVRGAARGSVRGAARGAARGSVRGAARGSVRGSVRGAARGAARGSVRGAARGSVRGSVRGAARGTTRGEVRGTARGEVRGTVRGEVRGVARGERLQESMIESIYAEFEDVLYLLPDRIEPIAPRRIGYAADAQPNLYFYMNKPSSKPIEFTLNRKDELDPVIVSYIQVDPDTGVIDPGIRSISIKELDVTLEEGVEYEWFVTIVVDVIERSSDIVASGIVVHEEDAEVLLISENQGLPAYGIYSASGYWYDAVDAVMLLRGEDDRTSPFNQQLIHWLSQEKLPSTRSSLSGS